jgi:hypothetical protein
MFRTKLLATTCFAALALGALTVSIAQAGEWNVNGTKLVRSAALLSTFAVLAHGKIVVKTTPNIVIECTASTVAVNGGELVQPDEVRIKNLTFGKCVATDGCTVFDEEIRTLAVDGLAVLEGPLNTLVLFSPLPLALATLAVINLTGENCALQGGLSVRALEGAAALDLLLREGRDPAVSHLALASSLELKIVSSEVEISGIDTDLRLASGQTWNFL